jgi:CRP/FNR family transcriptional regulator
MAIGIAVTAPGSKPRTSMARVEIKPTPRRVQRAVAHVGALQQALASSQQASIAVRQHLADLDGADAPLGAIPATREEEVTKLPHLAYSDEVTCLLDRTRLLDRLNHVLVRAERQQRDLTMLLRRLGNLPDLDDRLGRSAAGRLLQQTTERLSSCIGGGDATHVHDGSDAGLMSPGTSDGGDPSQAGKGSGNRSAAPLAVASQAMAAPAASVGVRHDGTGSAARRSPWKQPNFCLSAGLDPDATLQLERLLTQRVRFRKGDVVYRVGSGFHALYAICAGSCKTILLARDGHDQVAGYHMAGDIIGMDGVGSDIHGCQAAALEDLEIAPLPFEEVEILARNSDRFRRNLHRLLSREGVRAQALTIALGTMRAEQRLAAFLLDLSQRYQARGYSSCEFVLRMTREEIGSHLGLKLETVSRLFSRLQREGLIQVQGRTVKLLDRLAVGQLVDCAAWRESGAGIRPGSRPA